MNFAGPTSKQGPSTSTDQHEQNFGLRKPKAASHPEDLSTP
jgi:hypothetical protein